MAITIAKLITLDGQFTDWPASDMIMTPGNTVTGYQVFGATLNDATLGNTYVIGIDATVATDPVIAAGTTIYLNTDQNTATGYNLSFGNVGAEYEVQFVLGSNGVLQPYLYSVTSTGTPTLLNGGAPLNYGMSANNESFEVAIPRSLVTPNGGTAPKSINFAVLNGSTGLPANFASNPEYTIADTSSVVPVNTAVKKVGIVYSATTAALYFGGTPAGQTAYADLFMAAQQQARAAGVSYDLLTEADLTNVAKLSQYSALIFPDFQDVQSSQASAIASALNTVVYQYHVPIIASGNFMTNDQTGAALPGNSYANMQSLLNVTLNQSGTATYSVTPDPTALASNNPILAGYTAGQHIGGASGQFAGTTQGLYTNTGYLTFKAFTGTATTLADINIQGGATVPGVIQTTSGGKNTVFATDSLLGDSNLLQHVIQNTVFGTTPSLTMDITRFTGIVNSRTDMDQSQFPEDVSPSANGSPPGTPGIYDEMIPILQTLKQQYDFVGSYYINIGDDANPSNDNMTNWAVSAPIYDTILRMGNEIGNHSYTHLIAPPAGIPTENTNYLSTAGTGTFTYNYEFGQSKTIEQQQLGITIAGAAVPGANDYLPDSKNILPYYPSTSGVTGYVSGGWTGVGSGYPNAFGYITPSDTESVYIAPNVTFDFTEIEFQKKTSAQALADWESLFGQLSANSATPVIVWPWHDYGITDYPTSGPGTTPPGYTEAMYQNFIAYAYNAGYEFVTSEDLASRIAAEQAATLSETTSGSVITATVTPNPSEPDLGAMALNVVNGTASQVIQNAGSWYAYDANSIFMPYGGGTFTVTLGTTQDDVTHIDSLPMRADLKSVTGNGTNLTFSMTGDGVVDIHIKTPGAGTNVVSVQGLPATATATLNGDDLKLTFNDGALAISSTSPVGVPVQHTVTITEGTTAIAGAINFSNGPSVAITGAGGLTNKPSQTISGTVTESTESQVVGTTVSLYDNGSTTALATATVGTSGSWSTPVTLSAGANSIVAKDTDTAGNTGSSPAVVYTLDTVAPTVTITSPQSGYTNKASQTISGAVTAATGEAPIGTTVTLYDNGSTTALATATVTNGSWSVPVTLIAGANSIVAKDTDTAGNTGASPAVVYTLDTVAPTVTITSPSAGPIGQASQTIGGTVTAAATGGAPIGTTVTLYDNGSTTALATATVGTNGSWSSTPVTLSAGSNSIVAKDTDAAGNTGSSAAVVYTLGTIAPAVTITSPQSGYTNKASQTIGGTVTKAPGETAALGATVTLYDNGSTTALATAPVGTNGSWSAPVTLSAGANSIVAKDTDAAGNTGASAAVVYTLDTVAPTLTITSAGGSTSQASQTISGTVTAAATGGAPNGATVSLYDNGSTTALATAPVGTNGSWSAPVTLIPGANSIVAKDTDAAGNTGSSNSVTFTLSVASGVTVAYFLANRATLDALNNGFTIADSSSTIVKNLTGVSTDPLNDSNINAISLTDSPATLTATVAQALNDATALNNIANLPSTFTVADKAAAIQALTVAQINVLGQEGVTDLDTTDKAATLTSAQTTALNNAGISVDPFA
jgi:serralysin